MHFYELGGAGRYLPIIRGAIPLHHIAPQPQKLIVFGVNISRYVFLLLCLQQELFRSRKKRDRKGRHGGDAGLDDDRLEAELSLIQRPQISDALPCVVFWFVVRVVTGIPSSVRLVIELYHDRQMTQEPADDEEPGWWVGYVKLTDSLLYADFCVIFPFEVPSVLWRCWLGGRKGIRPVKN